MQYFGQQQLAISVYDFHVISSVFISKLKCLKMFVLIKIIIVSSHKDDSFTVDREIISESRDE